jgi:hypothetical protein
MKHPPDTLDTLDAATASLMLYVAGELDAEALVAFENRLAADAALRAQLEELTGVDTQLKRHVASTPINASDSRQSLTRTVRTVREHVLANIERENRSGVRRSLRLPGWAWGSGVAAMLMIGFVFWVISSDPIKVPPAEISHNEPGTIGRGELGGNDALREFASAFGAVDNGVNVEEFNELQTQVDALNVLATLNESMSDDLGDSN